MRRTIKVELTELELKLFANAIEFWLEKNSVVARRQMKQLLYIVREAAAQGKQETQG